MCTQKNIRDHIIKGILDSDMVEALLQETNLTLAKTISKMPSTKKQRVSLASQQPEIIAALQKPQEKRIMVFPTITTHWM